MSVSLRAATNFFASSTAPVVTIPATTQGTDSMYIVSAGGWAPSATPPTGWTLVSSPVGTYWQWVIYKRIAAGTYGTTSSDAGTNVTLSYSNSFDVQSSILVVDTQGATISPFMTSLYDATAVAGTLNPTARNGDLIVYVGSTRPNASTTITLSRGTTLNTRSADTNSGAVLGYESITSTGAISQTFTPSVTGSGALGRIYIAFQFAQPFSDSFAGAGEVRASTAVAGIDTTGWSTEVGEPGSLDKTGWVTFTAVSTSLHTLSTVGSNYDTVINIYTGSSISALTLVASDDDSGGSGTSLLQTTLTNGTQYYIQVGTKSGGAGGLLTFQIDQASQVQLTATHTEVMTDGAGQTGGKPQVQLAAGHAEIITDGAGNTGGLSRTQLIAMHIELLTPSRKAFVGWGIER